MNILLVCPTPSEIRMIYTPFGNAFTLMLLVFFVEITSLPNILYIETSVASDNP